MINFEVEDHTGKSQVIEVPEDISLSLMEVLVASEYPILATCGGMALCATCHVLVEEGMDNLNPSNDAELDMLDTLPDAKHNSRLACQIRVNEGMQGCRFKLPG